MKAFPLLPAIRAPRCRAWFAVVAALVFPGCLVAAEPGSTPGSFSFGRGVAAEHPGDVGLANDPRVVFVENFEEATVAALASRWEAVNAVDSMSFTHDVPSGSAGSKSLILDRRTGPELNVNFLWLYVHAEKPAGHRIRGQFDDVVVATEHIGPIKPRGVAGATDGVPTGPFRVPGPRWRVAPVRRSSTVPA